MEKYLWPLVTFLLGLLANSFLKPYLSKKGENLATKEDIQDLVKQTKALTQATEEIKAEISVDVWYRQRQWELKRDAVSSVMLAFSKANDAIHLFGQLDVQERSKNPYLFTEAANTKRGGML